VSKASKEDLVNQRVGKTIAKKRKAAGYTQEQVAEHLGIGTEAFSRIERGVNAVSIAKLFELADMFECGVETFLIEGSRRVTEQVELIDRLISGLSVADRQFVVHLVDRLARRFKAGPTDAKKSRVEDDTQGFLL
jgi:transcriptional regulator with XRE-family HTH domain